MHAIFFAPTNSLKELTIRLASSDGASDMVSALPIKLAPQTHCCSGRVRDASAQPALVSCIAQTENAA